MKKLLALVLITIATQHISAQIRFGLKAGLNISNILITSPLQGVDKFSPINAFNGGFQASFPITHHFYLQPEVMYSGHGGTMNAHTTRYDYLNFPLLIKYRGTAGWFAETGMQPSFLMASNEPKNGNDGKSQRGPDDNCWVLGGGYQLPKTHFGLDIRYYQSFTAFYTVNGQNIYGKNSIIQFDLTYVF